MLYSVDFHRGLPERAEREASHLLEIGRFALCPLRFAISLMISVAILCVMKSLQASVEQIGRLHLLIVILSAARNLITC